MDFRRRLLQPEAPGVWEDPRSNLEVFCHEATFQKWRGSWQFKISQFSETENCGTGSQKVAHHFSAFRLAKTPSIAIWAKKKNLGRIFGFFSFYPTGPSLGEKESTDFPGSTFDIFRFPILILFFAKYFRNVCLNNKGVLERPGTKWRVLRAISSTSKCKFTENCWKVDFSMLCKTKSRENLLRCLRTVRAVTLDTSRPPQFHLK